LKFHEPVLVAEVLDALRVKEIAHSKKATRGKFIDATLGLGGHTIPMVKAGAYVLGIDADLDSLETARERLELACPSSDISDNMGRSFVLAHGNFKEIGKIAKDNGFVGIDGVLFDLGISSYQLERKNIGLSFQDQSALLDMRIDPNSNGVKASDLLKVLNEGQLTELFATTLEKYRARLIAKAIVTERTKSEIRKVGDFLYTIRGIIRPKNRLDPATLPFLALRIAVNNEVENLRVALPQAYDLIIPGGRLVVISFHSGEDITVKNFFRQKKAELKAVLVTKKPIKPDLSEIEINSRARSAKMRILEKV